MKTEKVLWRSIHDGTWLVASLKETRVGFETEFSFSEDINDASIINRMPPNIRSLVEPVNVVVTRTVEIV